MAAHVDRVGQGRAPTKTRFLIGTQRAEQQQLFSPFIRKNQTGRAPSGSDYRRPTVAVFRIRPIHTRFNVAQPIDKPGPKVDWKNSTNYNYIAF